MNGKEAIIEKILADAERNANATIAEAEERADTMIAATVASCKNYMYEREAELQKQVSEIASRRKTVAELDVKKLLLKKKTEIVDSAFNRAAERVRALDDKTYLRIIEGMLRYAADGDVVTVSAQDKDTITKAFIDKYASKNGIKLTLSTVFGDFKGGIVLSGGGVDKNLTLEVELKALRDELETEVSERIFGARA